MEHKEYIQSLRDEDPQLYTEDTIDSLPRHFMGLSISKTQLNYRFEMVATQKKKVNRSKEYAIDELNREKPIIMCDVKESNAQNNTTLATKGTTTVKFIKCINILPNFMNFIEFQRNTFTRLVLFFLWRGERFDI